MDTAFEELKAKIREDVTLSFPDFSPDHQPLELYVDASASGSGACLCQKQGDQVKIIAYASSSFSAAEANYSTIEKELAALRWGVKTFRPFLIGMEFVIHTDHQPLMYLNNMKLVDSRLARTLEDLSDFNFEIRYTPGRENAAADCLSRLYSPDSIHSNTGSRFTPGKLPSGLYTSCKVEGGGDSLFESLATASERTILQRAPVSTALVMRSLLIGELLKSPERYGLKLDRHVRKKLRLMEFPGQLPGVEVLFAFGFLFGCVILVHYGAENPIVYLPPGSEEVNGLSRIHLQCLAGIHYNPLYELPHYKYDGTPKYMRARMTADDKSEPVASEEDCLSEDEVDVHCTFLDTRPLDWCPLHEHTHFASCCLVLKGHKCCALLDTGAQVSCISYRLITKLGAKIDTGTNITLTSFGTLSSSALGTVLLAVGLESVHHGPYIHEFVVVEDRMMPFCLILGADYIVAHDIALDFVSGQYVQSGQPLKGKFFQPQMETAPDSVALTVVGCMTISVRTKEVCVGSAANHLTFTVERDEEDAITGLLHLISLDEVVNLQEHSSQLRALKRNISLPLKEWPASLMRFKRFSDSLVVSGGIVLYRNTMDKLVPLVTFNFLVELVLVIHHQLAHISRTKLIESVRRLVWHPSIAKVARDVTRSCDACQRLKVASLVAPPMLKIATSVPFELVSLDLVSMSATRGFVACLVVMDHHTKWLSAIPVRNKTSTTVASVFEHHVLPFLPHVPKKVLSDNGPEFSGAGFNQVLETYGIKHLYTTPNKPSSNGLIERANRTLLELIRMQVGPSLTWYDVLPRAVITHNTTFHSALGQSPSDYIFESSHRSDGDIIVSQAARKDWRKGHLSFGSFKPDDVVLRRTVRKGNETSNKFVERFEGPYSVRQVHENGLTYKLISDRTGLEVRAHHTQLRAYHLPLKYIADHPAYLRLTGVPDVPVTCKDIEVDEADNASDNPQSGVSYWSPADSSSAYDSETDEISNCNTSCSTSGSVFKAPLCDEEALIDQVPVTGDRMSTPVKTCYVVPLWDFSRLQSSDEAVSKNDRVEVDDAPALVGAGCLSGSTVLPRTEELLSGIVIENSFEFWGQSSIHTDSFSGILGGEDRNSSVPGEVPLLNETLKWLEAEFSGSSLFSGFGQTVSNELDDVQANLTSAEEQLEEISRNLQGGDATPICCIRQHLTSASRRLSELRASVQERRRSARLSQQLQARGLHVDARSPVSTRSRGPVATLPHVIPRALEYDIPPCGGDSE
jgi:hypothetical protein